MEEISMTTSESRKCNRIRLKEKHQRLRAGLGGRDAMDPDVKKAWLRALRSGKYKQGKEALCRVDDQGAYSFCCLGVLGDECIDADWHLHESSGTHSLGLDGQSGGLKGGDMEALGLSLGAAIALAEANDDGLRFSTIADAIEECL